jgi:hypothetical protein
MKANELRIGNLVNEWYGVDKKYFIKKITAEDIRALDENWRDYKGILLTKKEVIELGFEYNDFEDLYQKDGFDVDIEDGVYCHFYLNEYGDWYKDIDYVHQLQNLYFALTGEELTYNC